MTMFLQGLQQQFRVLAANKHLQSPPLHLDFVGELLNIDKEVLLGSCKAQDEPGVKYDFRINETSTSFSAFDDCQDVQEQI